MKKLKQFLFTALFIAAATGAAAQEAKPAAQKITMDSLLRSGFAIADMQYLANSIVFVFQRHAVAYICDANLNGETKICVRLK